MGVKKFIRNVLKSLNMDGFELKNKKKSLKTLLEKLKKKKVKILSLLETETDQEKKALIQEELEIVIFHIKKGEKMLKDLKEI